MNKKIVFIALSFTLLLLILSFTYTPIEKTRDEKIIDIDKFDSISINIPEWELYLLQTKNLENQERLNFRQIENINDFYNIKVVNKELIVTKKWRKWSFDNTFIQLWIYVNDLKNINIGGNTKVFAGRTPLSHFTSNIPLEFSKINININIKDNSKLNIDSNFGIININASNNSEIRVKWRASEFYANIDDNSELRGYLLDSQKAKIIAKWNSIVWCKSNVDIELNNNSKFYYFWDAPLEVSKNSFPYYKDNKFWFYSNGRIYETGYYLENWEIFLKSDPRLKIKKLENVDVSSFELVTFSYDKEKNTINYWPLAKDKNNIFTYGEILEWANPETLEVVDFNFVKDDKNVYSMWQFLGGSETIKWLDSKSFEVYFDNYISDKNGSYEIIWGTIWMSNNELIKISDKVFKKFKLIWLSYLWDTDETIKYFNGDNIVYFSIYKNSLKKIIGADVETFEIVRKNKEYDAKDKNHKYKKWQIVE